MQINTDRAGFKRFEQLKRFTTFGRFQDVRTRKEPQVFIKLDDQQVAVVGDPAPYFMRPTEFVFPVSIDAIGIQKE